MPWAFTGIMEGKYKKLISKFQAALQKIDEANNILLIGHLNPDADALSSLGILIEMLLDRNKKFLAYAKDKSQGTFSFLPREDYIFGELPESFHLRDFDLLITLDCGGLNRTGLETEIKKLQEDGVNDLYILEFDHHQPPLPYSDLEIRIPELASTTQLLNYFLEANNIAINRNLANLILTGIVYDTGNFKYVAASDETLKVASKMMRLGAQLPKINNLVKDNYHPGLLRVKGLALDNLRINEKHKIAVSVITQEELNNLKLEEFELNGDVYSDIVDFLGNLSDIKAVLLLRENEKGELKGSLRSNGSNVNVSNLAKIFNGGGHIKASGFSISGKIDKKGEGWEVIL